MKQLITTCIALMLCSTAFSQFQIDFGGGIAISNKKELNFMIPTVNSLGQKDTSFATYKISASGLGIYAYPKYHFQEFMGHSLSVGAPLILGVDASASSSGESSFSFMYDFNVAADINGGRLNKVSDNSDKMIGYFAGLGLGILNTNGVGYDGGSSTNNVNANTKNIITIGEGQDIYSEMSAKSVGFLLHAGVVAPYKFDLENERSMGLRLFLKPGLGKNQLTYFGICAYISLGDWGSEGSRSKNSKSKSKKR